MNTSRNYVGITGVCTSDEAKDVAGIFEHHGFYPGANHVGMVGVLAASEQRFAGERMATRHPKTPEQIARIFSAIHGRVWPMIHLEVSKEQGNAEPFAAGASRVLDESGVYRKGLCHTLQLNGYPDAKEVEALLRQYPALQCVYQIRKELVAAGGSAVVEALRLYGSAFAHALIDPSAGTGAEFDIERAKQIYTALQEAYPNLAFGFAGGFSPQNTADRVRSLRGYTGTDQWSIDVEGKVRDPQTDALDLDRFATYVTAARHGFSQ